jgi:hypothetical protein
MDPTFELPLDALLRSMTVNRELSHALLVGAGASISSGVKSANRCLWEWKQQIFLTNQSPEVVPHFRELSLPSVQRRIQDWLNEQGLYPAPGALEEYGVYAERCLPLHGDRAAYFRGLFRDARPGLGYQLLAVLAKAGTVSSVWTTNFDGLSARAASTAGVEVIEVGEDSVERLSRPRPRRSLLHVALHGDYRYDDLRNTPTELRSQNERLEQALSAEFRSTTALIVGYSGRDQSIMRALSRAYASAGSGRLFWCGYEDEEPLASVPTLIRWARDHGHEAYYVRAHGFDDLMFRLATHCLDGDGAAEAQRVVASATATFEERSPAFRIELVNTSGVIKSNAFPITLPGEVLQFTSDTFAGKGAWSALRTKTLGTRIVAVPQGGKVLALGLVDDVRSVFDDSAIGPIERSPITERDLGRRDGAVTSLLTSALVRAVAEARGLDCDGEGLIWTSERGEKRVIMGKACFVRQAAILRLQRQAGADYLVIKPSIRVTDGTGAEAPDEIAKEAKRQILGRQWNQPFNDALNAWVKRIAPSRGATRFEFPNGAASTFSFSVERIPIFAKIQTTRPDQAISLAPKLARVAKQVGTAFDEPSLLFSGRRSGSEVSDPHPLRGLVQNRPYDHALTTCGLKGDVRLGVVCPNGDASQLGNFLGRLNQQIEIDSKQEYLVAFPGFQQAFGIALDIPNRGSALSVGISEPERGEDVRRGALRLRGEIQHAIDALVAAAKPTVIVIYVPRRWKSWEHYDFDGEYFDLHDFIKAYCIQKGVATQFLREETTTKRYACEVAWWLALSLYVKSMRTPWILDGLDSDTAFVGLGFSIDPSAQRGRHVLLGCSHMYNPSGLGLTFRLSKIEDGFYRRGNPFMSRADARRMAESVCEMFWDARDKLPSRVVFHRRTPFRREEREGLIEGLFGVRQVDMIEINVEPMTRYVAARVGQDGTAQGDAYPVRRGSAVVLERDRALLWVHGSADPVKPGSRPYYQGKSRIPAPLVIKRHHGRSELDTIAREILGLSKMNWNSADMYTKLPATIESSNRIAEIGALIERTQPESFDYRLFI